MKLNRGIILGIFLFAVACSQQKEIIHDQILVHDGQGQQMGGTDSGGGSGFNGKPLESYRFDINSLSDFPRVNQIINQVLQTFPELAGDMWHITQDRRWYKLPTNLSVIPSERIGVAFPTDQLALQNLSEIWIDDNAFTGQMAPEDRSILILHEIVMGIRLMEFQDSLDQCLAKVASSALSAKTPAQKGKYESARKDCFRSYSAVDGNGIDPSQHLLPDPDGAHISLSKIDYENIRYLVTQLWSSGGNVDGLEVKDWMKEKGFRKY